MIILAWLLALIGYGLLLAAYVWVVYLAFQESAGWGIACLICGPAQLIFVIQHWEDCQNPAMCWAGGFLCAVGARFMIGV